MDEHKKHDPAYNTVPAGAEKSLHDFYTKTITLNLPTGGQKWLAENAWWLSLVGGILSLWGAWSFWSVAHYASQWIRWANEVAGTTTNLGVAWYITLVAMIVQAVLLLVAVQQLKTHKKSGWNLLLYTSYVSVITGVLDLFVPGYGFSGLVGMVIGALIGWFFLFQVRGYFVK